MRQNPIPWPPHRRNVEPEHRPANTGLSSEDGETQAQVDRYLHLAENMLSTDEPDTTEAESDREAA